MRYTALTLEDIVVSSTGAVEFAFHPKRPLHYSAGQGGLIIVSGGGGKPFTFASDDRTDSISIATTMASGSRFKRALGDLRSGERVHVVGPIGTLPVVLDPAEHQVFIAQGIGITPFLSMARSQDSLNATLLQVGTPHFFDEVAAATSNAVHHDHRAALQHAVRRTVADRPTARWSVSGRRDFVGAVAAQLASAGVSASRVHKDSFWGMSTPDVTPCRDLIDT